MGLKKLNFNINDYPDFKNKIEYIVINIEPEDLIKDEHLLNNRSIKDLIVLKELNNLIIICI